MMGDVGSMESVARVENAPWGKRRQGRGKNKRLTHRCVKLSPGLRRPGQNVNDNDRVGMAAAKASVPAMGAV